MPPWIRRTLVGIASIIVGLAILVMLYAWSLRQPRPDTGETGPAADAMAHRIEEATGQRAWTQFGAVAWNFDDRHSHLWDRARGYDRVRHGEYEVLLRVGDGTGVARRSGEVLSGDEARAALAKAQALFFNDSWWLNPFPKFFDEGVTRSRITTSRGEALLVEFAQGGTTPGDAYAIYVDADGRPRLWEMWVAIIPIAGIGATWEQWQDVGGGAWMSRHHAMGPRSLRLFDVRTAGTLAELGDDPFGELE